jgi:hypothetical protein
MRRLYGSVDDARRAFDEYARIEPELTPLWDLCERAAPPVRATDDDDDVNDPFDVDVIATDRSYDGWCAEDFFGEHVKSRLLLLAGVYRSGDPEALRSSDAYDALYDLLVNWALNRPCACCSNPNDERDANRGDNGGQAHGARE